MLIGAQGSFALLRARPAAHRDCERLTDAPLKAHQPFLSSQELEVAVIQAVTWRCALGSWPPPSPGAMDGGAGIGFVSLLECSSTPLFTCSSSPQPFTGPYSPSETSLVAQMVKRLPTVQETWVRSLGQEDLLEKGMATHSGILAHPHPHKKRGLHGTFWRREWQPTPVLLPGKSHGQRSLVG